MHLSDIEDFSTDVLRYEIHRREQATQEGRCWYCNKNLEAHTCKYAKPSPVPGWEISPPRWVSTEDCMANKQEYWQVDGYHPVMGKHVIGGGDTKEEATNKCIKNAKERQDKWNLSPGRKG
jgi:hypothetical protein